MTPPPEPTPPKPRRPRQLDIRRVAMQALFAIDAMQMGPSPPIQRVLEAVEDPHDHGFDASDEATRLVEEAEAERLEAARLRGVELALEAWAMHERADARVRELAPDWPTHRQPPVDRALLRLAYAEMQTGRNAPAVAIHEAVQLARDFSTERSPAFVNALLDRMKPAGAASGTTEPDAADRPAAADPWLSDALARPEGGSGGDAGPADGGHRGPI